MESIASENAENLENVEDMENNLPENKNIPKILCQMCKTHEFKYKCPRCSLKTCCVFCVKEHKKKFKCTGTRDKFSSESKLNNFTEKELFRDMKFLNEAIRETNKASKKVFSMTEDDEKKDKEKKNKYNRKCARKFRNINLHCSPSIMKKFTENKSYIDYKNKKFNWTVKFIIHTPEEKQYEHIFKETFDDSLYTLNDLLNLIKTEKEKLDLDLLMYINSLKENELENSSVLLKLNLKEMDKNFIRGQVVKVKKVIYEDCNKNMILKDVLEGKDILEYPEFHVMLNFNLSENKIANINK